MNFSCIITPNSIVFTNPNGKTINVTDAHPAFGEMCELVKAIQIARKEGREDDASQLHLTLSDLAEPARVITSQGHGRVSVRDGVVFIGDQAVHNTITERILWGLGEGYDMDPYIRFLDNLMENPSKRAIDELYGFMERSKMGLTEDGHLIAYKRVRDDYRDIHSASFDNSPGQVLEMPRNAVDDDKDRTCSSGFHFCSMSYLPYFGSSSGNRIVIVKINPRDVVSIPSDYNQAKARACRYEVIGEYEGDDKDDILATKPIWSDQDWRSAFDSEWDDQDDEDENEDNEDDSWDDNDSWDDMVFDLVDSDGSTEPVSAPAQAPAPTPGAMMSVDEAMSVVSALISERDGPFSNIYRPDGEAVPVFANTAPMVPRTEAPGSFEAIQTALTTPTPPVAEPTEPGVEPFPIRLFYRYDPASPGILAAIDVTYSDGRYEEVTDKTRMSLIIERYMLGKK